MAIDQIGSAGLAAGGVEPADLSTGAPSWDTSGNIAVSGAVKVSGQLNTSVITANSTFVDNFSGARVLSYGPDTSTNGTFSFCFVLCCLP